MIALPNQTRALPHSIEAEECLLSCCMLDGADVISRCLEARIRPESFYVAAHGIIFERLLDLYNRQQPIDISIIAEELKTTRQLDAVGGYAFLTQVSARIPTTAQAGYYIDKVRDYALKREAIRVASSAIERAHDGAQSTVEIVGTLKANLETLAVSPGGSIIRSLVERRAGCGRLVSEQEPTFSLAGTAITTRGNISMLTAQKKEGKSAIVGAMLGAVIGGPECSGDTLRFTSDNRAGHAVIHIDTEQAPEDHERLFATALKRSGFSQPPPWIYSYGAKGLSIEQLRSTLTRLLAETNKIHGGIFAVILDGVADFVADPNDPKECNPFVTQLEAIATDYNASVICVLHLNPVAANNTAAKSRGHLGSQLERKCETDLRLTKDGDGVTTIFTACARRAPILEKDGPRFSWDTSAGMHTSLSQSGGSERENEKSEALRELRDDVFGGRPSMRYGDLIIAFKNAFKCSDATSERKFREMKKLGLIEKFPPNLWAKAV